MTPRRRAWSVLALAAAVLASAWAQPPLDADRDLAYATPPTAVRYADRAWYDLVDVRWAVDAEGRPAALELELAAIDPVQPLLQPILEAYLMVGEGGASELLPGSGVVLADDQGWAVAVRVTGQGAWVWRADGDAPGRPVAVAVDGRVVRLAWPADLPVEGRWAALSGVYDPFHASGWRAFARIPSPWTFAVAEPGAPVVDAFPDDASTLVQLRDGRPWSPRRPAAIPALASTWWWWMVVGLALAVLGLVWRRVQPPAPVPTLTPVGHVDLIDDADVTSGPSGDAAEEEPSADPADPVPADDGPSAPEPADDAAVRDAATDPVPADDGGRSPDRYEAEDRPVTGTAAGTVADDGSATSPPSSRTTRAPRDARRPAKRS